MKLALEIIGCIALLVYIVTTVDVWLERVHRR